MLNAIENFATSMAKSPVKILDIEVESKDIVILKSGYWDIAPPQCSSPLEVSSQNKCLHCRIGAPILKS